MNNKNNSQTLSSEMHMYFEHKAFDQEFQVILPVFCTFSNQSNDYSFVIIRLKESVHAYAVTEWINFIQNFYTYVYTSWEIQNGPLNFEG